MTAKRSRHAPETDGKQPHQLFVFRRAGVRRIILPRWTFPAAIAATAVMTLWAAGATGLVLFHDEIVTGMISREAGLRYSYEERISGLKAELARVNSRTLVDQQAFADKVDGLLRRQMTLEDRQSTLQSLAARLAPEAAGAIDPDATEDVTGSVQSPGPRPLPDTPHLLGRQSMTTGPAPAYADASGIRPRAAPFHYATVAGKLAAISGSLDMVEGSQERALGGFTAIARQRTGRIRDALESIGLDADHLAARNIAKADATGGPFVPMQLLPDASAFDTEAYKAELSLASAQALESVLDNIPLKRPSRSAITSSFGSRSDPFLGEAAMHTGIDFRYSLGAPVASTAAGTVSIAAWTGGYGNLVEINHGNGIATRYGHLSQITVRVGERIAAGETIGLAGSTGRSTGPHLHYETRVNGVPVDPLRFFAAGRMIAQQ